MGALPAVHPGWVTACVALVVGGFTIFGVLTARRAYIKSVDDTHKAVARLVWVERMGPTTLPTAGSKSGGRPSYLPAHDAEISSPSLFQAGEEHGERVSLWAVDAVRTFARITNNSREPIGSVRLGVHRGRTLIASSRMLFRAIPPESSRVVEIHFARSALGHDARADAVRLELRFTDSAGQRWTRIGTRPPIPIDPARRPRFRHLRAWWFRRRLAVSKMLRRGTRD